MNIYFTFKYYWNKNISVFIIFPFPSNKYPDFHVHLVSGAIQCILLMVLALTHVAATVVLVLMMTEEAIWASNNTQFVQSYAKIGQLYVTVSMSVYEIGERRADGYGP
jgi:hypothetical protein